jgi:hypothetical protein
MCWADRVAIVWGGIVYFVLMVFWLVDGIGAYFHMLFSYPGALGIFAFLIAPVWLFLRGIRWISRGP